MTTTLDSEVTLKAITETIQSLNIEEKYQLLEIIEQQIFAAEEENYEDDRETLNEMEAIQNEYKAGEYITFDEYRKNRSKSKV
ncbi:hypothetical protein [Spirulina sp. 06S082]|uniref:hypothetical protein n=1 Tax=Spirulina sp. 06S082 TaxID=3110248 RepID=UPI002B1F760B|nr:hypothetical protein [Spirulina sp. 06S082]MEA5470881.1 hypothetical protein [Spirulina sp. 06S082]